MTCKFKTMWENELTAEIEIVNNVVVSQHVITNDFAKAILVLTPLTFEYIDGVFSLRVFERTNGSVDFFLHRLGLTEYNHWEIIKRTHGHWMGDHKWLVFEGDNYTWESYLHEYENNSI